MVEPAHLRPPKYTEFTSKWLRFVWKSSTGKTDVWEVRAKQGDILLGLVKWYGPFRAYSFFPEPNTVYEKTCVTNIAFFLVRLMDERKAAKAPKQIKVFYPLIEKQKPCTSS